MMYYDFDKFLIKSLTKSKCKYNFLFNIKNGSNLFSVLTKSNIIPK